MYCFGLYHWRERLRSVLVAIGALGGSMWLRRATASRVVRAVATATALGAVVRLAGLASKLLSPPPWAIERYKYDALGAELSFEHASRALDIGCGTGRSLVGLAPHVPEECLVIGLDVFDDRVILGNAPKLARRNASEAGLDATPVAGDAARIPLTEDSQGIVTACRVLHDLPAEDADRALREIRRVCNPEGVLGVLELPLTPDGVTAPPAAYWRDRISEAGFDIETIERIERTRHNDPYILIVATPVA